MTVTTQGFLSWLKDHGLDPDRVKKVEFTPDSIHMNGVSFIVYEIERDEQGYMVVEKNDIKLSARFVKLKSLP